VKGLMVRGTRSREKDWFVYLGCQGFRELGRFVREELLMEE
jgi:hypothetical protein